VSAWQHKPLGKILTQIKTGSTPPTSRPDFFGGTVPWFTPGDIGATSDLIKSSRYITEEAVKNGEAPLFAEGVLLVTCIGEIGRVGILQQPSSSNQQITALKFCDEVDVYYAYYWFIAHQDRLGHLANQAIVPILNNERLKGAEFFYPPLPVQQRIAAILAKADRLRRLRHTAREFGDTYLQSVFLEMFGDPVKNPKGWESEAIRNVCDKVIDYRGRTPPYSDNGIPHITASCIKGSRIDWTQCKYVSGETFASYMTRGLPEYGDVIFTTEAPIGETAVVNTQERFSLAQRLVLLRTTKSRMLPHYLSMLLSHPSFLPRLRQFVTGSTVVGIRSVHLISIRIPVPPLPLQQQFTHIVHQYERLRAQQREAERQAEHLFQTLLHRAFRGEL
jgi:type I restriction enzyme S subunit